MVEVVTIIISYSKMGKMLNSSKNKNIILRRFMVKGAKNNTKILNFLHKTNRLNVNRKVDRFEVGKPKQPINYYFYTNNSYVNN